MVCEIAQHEAFQKILLKKIEKLRKHLEKAENDLDEKMKENEELKEEKFDYNVFLEERNNMAIMLSEQATENEKLKNENEELKKLLNVSLNRGADLRKQVQIEKDRT